MSNSNGHQAVAYEPKEVYAMKAKYSVRATCKDTIESMPKDKDGKTEPVIKGLFAVDAKEMVGTGRYEWFGEVPMGVSLSKEEPIIIEKEAELGFDSMTADNLDKFVKSNGIKIKGFSDMKLVEKRNALKEKLA